MKTRITIVALFATGMAYARPPQEGGEGQRRERGGSESGSRPGFVERLDRDGDGQVSKSEFNGPAEHFARFDQNGDGYIGEDEAPTGPPPRMREGGDDQDQNRKPRREGGEDGDRQGRQQKKGGGFVVHFDTDGDGKVSADEFKGPEEHFERFDRNGDGYVDAQEAPKDPPPQKGQKKNNR